MTLLGKVVCALALIVGLFFARAGTFLLLWNWFARPVFDGAPELSFAQAMGLSLLVNFLVTTTFPDTDDDKTFGEIMGEAVLKGTLYYGIVLIAAVNVHQFT